MPKLKVILAGAITGATGFPKISPKLCDGTKKPLKNTMLLPKIGLACAMPGARAFHKTRWKHLPGIAARRSKVFIGDSTISVAATNEEPACLRISLRRPAGIVELLNKETALLRII